MNAHPTIPALGTVLGVWAHPDDEAYCSAGLMALVRRHGGRVVVATATWGEQGSAEPRLVPPARLAHVRRLELGASLAELGVREHRFLGFRDGTCSTVPFATGVARVRRLLDDIRPDTIVTFGPDGMTGHPDHRAVSAWTTAAWDETGRAARLWYATLTDEFHETWGATNRSTGLFDDTDDVPSWPCDELAFEIRLPDDVLDRKVDALLAQRSQTQSLVDRVGLDRYRRWWATESFVDAARVLDGARARHAA